MANWITEQARLAALRWASQGPDQAKGKGRDELVRVDREKETATTSDGEVLDAILQGAPHNVDAGVRLNSKVMVVQREDWIPSDDGGGTAHLYLLTRSQFLTGLKYTYHLVDTQTEATFPLRITYEIDAYGVSGLPDPTVESGDRIFALRFSTTGKHILVAGVVDNQDRDIPYTVYWGIMKNWKINKDIDDPQITYTLQQGSYDLVRADLDLASDPGSPGPDTLELNYERSQTGSGPDAECPYSPPDSYGATMFVKSYEESVKWELGPPIDAKLLELQDPGANLKILPDAMEFIFKEQGNGEPQIDFCFTYTSTYRRFKFYDVKKKTTEVNYELENQQYQIGCFNFCNTSYTKELLVEETFMYGEVDQDVFDGVDYVENPCDGYDMDGNIVPQSRDTSSSAEVEIHCKRTGTGTGSFCISAEGDCSSLVDDGAPACPQGFPTCFFKMETDCPIPPFPNFYTDEANPDCDDPENAGLGPDSFNYSMKELTVQGLMSIRNLSGGPTVTVNPTNEKTAFSLLTVESTSVPICNIPIVSWPGPFTSNGSDITLTYLDRNVGDTPFDGTRYDVLPLKGFSDPSGAESLLTLDQGTGEIARFSPSYDTLNDSLGPSAGDQLLCATDLVFTNDSFSPKPDEGHIRARKSRIFFTLKEQDPNVFTVGAREWRGDPPSTFKKKNETKGRWMLQGNDVIKDFIVKKT